MKLPTGDSLTFDPGDSWNFDFHLSVNEGRLRAHVLRGGSYAVTSRSDAKTWSLETLSLPTRRKSQRLADLKGLTFSFSASGWLVIYQLGVAECLQNHGASDCRKCTKHIRTRAAVQLAAHDRMQCTQSLQIC